MVRCSTLYFVCPQRGKLSFLQTHNYSHVENMDLQTLRERCLRANTESGSGFATLLKDTSGENRKCPGTPPATSTFIKFLEISQPHRELVLLHPQPPQSTR